MSDIQRLRALLESGALLHPVSDAISIVDFANALHSVMGVPDVPAPLGERAAQIRGLIGEPEHLVMALADGFGMNFVEALDHDSFIRRHIATEMRTVFPSTTPIVLTTLATGHWPATHSVIGWFQRLREIDAVSTIIAYQRTADKKALSQLGVRAETAFPVPSRMGKSDKDALHFMPEHIVATEYSNYWTGYIKQHGYDADHPQQAIEMAIQAVRKSSRPTSVYIYLPQVDSAAHEHGTWHAATMQTARVVDRLLATLADALPSNARLVVTADHGHLDVPPDRTHVIEKSDELLKLCDDPFTGDQRAIYADVSDANMDAFRTAIHERFGGDFLVLTAQEVEECGLLGAAPLADETRRRMRKALVLSTGDAVLDYRATLDDSRFPLLSHHGGLTPAEIRVPLVLA
ncbi:MAG: alkaline phosphatase family protein [Chloroflexota bacterium]|nr:alkaline phosphatase family protein [Chloroflexota bacterium]